MTELNAALEACRNATDALIVSAEASGPAWAVPRAPGKWSPSQIVEHVARSLEQSANVATGRPATFPKLPAFLHPVVRTLVFKRVLKNSTFPKAKANKAMDPVAGPPTPADGRARLQAAYEQFDAACRDLASRHEPIKSSVFGAVKVEDYVRFIELHTRHHDKQMGARSGS